MPHSKMMGMVKHGLRPSSCHGVPARFIIKTLQVLLLNMSYPGFYCYDKTPDQSNLFKKKLFWGSQFQSITVC